MMPWRLVNFELHVLPTPNQISHWSQMRTPVSEDGSSLLPYNVWGTSIRVQCRSAYINEHCSSYQKLLRQADFDKSTNTFDLLDEYQYITCDNWGRTSIWPSWCSTHESSPQVRGSSATIICHTTAGSIGSAKLCSRCTFNAYTCRTPLLNLEGKSR